MPKDHENGDGHPAVHSNLPSSERQSVSFECGFDSVAESQTTHRRDVEILKEDSESEREDIIDCPGGENLLTEKR